MIKKKIIIFLILLYSVISVSAHDAHDAHEHGVAEMQIVIEEKQIEIIIHIPGADFIGFEHENLNDIEKEGIHKKIRSLELSGDDLIIFRTRQWMKVELNELHIGEAGHEEEHEESHEHNGHMDFELHVIYTMENSENLKDMQFNGLFSSFPTLSKIRWAMINDSGQTAGEVDALHNRIGL